MHTFQGNVCDGVSCHEGSKPSGAIRSRGFLELVINIPLLDMYSVAWHWLLNYQFSKLTSKIILPFPFPYPKRCTEEEIKTPCERSALPE